MEDRSIDELSRKVAGVVYSFAERKGYPIHLFVGQDAFVDGFRRANIPVGLNSETKRVSIFIDILHGEKISRVPIHVSYSQVARGSGDHLPYSLDSFRQSVKNMIVSSEGELFDRFNIRMDKPEDRKVMGGIVSKVPEVIRNMEESLRGSFVRYHENALLSRVGSTPELVPSLILPDVLRQFDLGQYERLAGEDKQLSNYAEEKRKFENNVARAFILRMVESKGFSLAYRDLGRALSVTDCLVEANRMKWEGFPEY